MPNAAWYRGQVGQTVEQRYFLTEFIAAGSFGGVYRADEVLNDKYVRSVALKLLPHSISMEAKGHQTGRRLDELQLNLQLDHPFIVKAFAVGKVELSGEDSLYVVMELAQQSLEEQVVKEPLGADEIRELAFHTASALDYMHGFRGGLVHRDLKPGNLLRIGNAWKVSDLGSAAALGGSGWVRSIPLGTAEYAPPEAWEGTVSPAWDIWSLGVILAEAASGRLPFTIDEGEEAADVVANEIPDLPLEFTNEMRKLVEGCLQKSPKQRPTAKNVISAVRDMLQSGSASLHQKQTQSPPQPQPNLPPKAPNKRSIPIADTSTGSSSPAGDAWSRPGGSGSGILRSAILRALEDDIVTSDEKRELNELRRQFNISLADAALMFSRLKTGKGGGRSSTMTPAANSIADPGSTGSNAGTALQPLIVDVNGAGPGALRTIGEAIREAAPGQWIDIRSGIYEESLVINKHVVLRGEATGKGQVVINNLNSHGITIDSGQAELINLTVSCQNKGLDGQLSGINITRGSLRMENCIVSATSEAGITALGADVRVELKDCELRGSSSVGISLSHGAEGKISGCQIWGAMNAGIFVSTGANLKLLTSSVERCAATGILLYRRSNARIQNCRIRDNRGDGISLQGSESARVMDCEIFDNHGLGISARDEAHAHVENCSISYNQRGALNIAHDSKVTQLNNRIQR